MLLETLQILSYGNRMWSLTSMMTILYTLSILYVFLLCLVLCKFSLIITCLYSLLLYMRFSRYKIFLTFRILLDLIAVNTIILLKSLIYVPMFLYIEYLSLYGNKTVWKSVGNFCKREPCVQRGEACSCSLWCSNPCKIKTKK